MNEMRAHWLFEEGSIFLNHGSFGACPRPVLAAQQALRERLETQPLRFMLRELPGLWSESRVRLAALIGGDHEGLALLPNATTAVNSVMRSLRLEAGDELVTISHAYNACKNVLHFVAERAGARVVVVDLPFPITGPDAVIEAVMDAVGPRTKLVLIDHVTSPTALVLPVGRICAELRSRGVLSLVDGAHAPGMLDYSVTELGCDFHTGNAHKWLCAPKGAAYLWTREEHRSWVRPAVISHGANAPTARQSRYLWEFDWTGTADPTAILTIPAAIDFMESLLPGGLPEVAARNRDLARAGRCLLLKRLGLEAPCPESMIGSIATIPLPDDAEDVVEDHFATSRLQDRLLFECGIEVPVMNFPAPPGRQIRISAQIYNEIADYEALAGALVEFLAS